MNSGLWTEPRVRTTFCWAVCSQINLIKTPQPLVQCYSWCKQFIFHPLPHKCVFSFSARHLQLHFVLVGVGPPFNTQLSQSWPGTNSVLYWLPFFPALHSSPELPFILPQWGQCVSRLQSLTAVTCDRWVKVLPMIRKSRSSDCTCFTLRNLFFFFFFALHSFIKGWHLKAQFQFYIHTYLYHHICI